MSGGVRFAVGLPTVGLFGDPELLVSLAVEAESFGWDGVFMWDHVLYHQSDWPVADPTVTMAAIAASTSGLRLGVLMTAAARRRVGKLAREIASLDALSGGRLVFGVGLGSMEREFSAFGEPDDPSVRAERLDETLSVLDRLWSGREVTFHGRHVQVDGVRMLPVPVQRPRPPVWCAGRWPARAPFRRAARWDGVMPTHASFGRATTMPPGVLAEIVAYVEAHRPRGDGPDQPFDIALEGTTSGRRRSQDAQAVAPYVAAGLTWWVEALGWWRGDVAAARTRIRQGPPARPS
jgi:alkanesulfonate monooxygenase SsuD/methylene tetrahydromethanopterin reductase-like flavin-dependent oxidoreductase (luciferase family)